MILLSGTVDENIYASVPKQAGSFLAKPYQISDFVESIQSLVESLKRTGRANLAGQHAPAKMLTGGL